MKFSKVCSNQTEVKRPSFWWSENTIQIEKLVWKFYKQNHLWEKYYLTVNNKLSFSFSIGSSQLHYSEYICCILQIIRDTYKVIVPKSNCGYTVELELKINEL